ncbi:MAG TPA: hypothetical protein VLT33_41605 [Labilithrix sp.]|nr:hypothetical protein [Labilithrix sp.]
MRLPLLLAVSLASLSLAACSGVDGGGSIRRAPGSDAPGEASAPDPKSTPAPSAAGCPATVPEAKAVSTTETNATDVRLLLGGDVVYRDGPTVYRVSHAGAKSTIYTSPDLVHAFADDSVLVTVESPNPPDAVVKILPVGPTSAGLPPGPGGSDGQALTISPPGWNAGGTYVFASDATSLYFMADVDNVGDTLYRVDKANPLQMTVVAQLDTASLSDPQLAGSDVWFVRDQKRVYKVAMAAAGADPKSPLGQGDGASPPVEVFGLGYADCKLAVGGAHAFCSTGKALEQRDLSGGSLVTVLDPMKSTTPGGLGAATFGSDAVLVRTLPSSPSDVLKNGIRALKVGATPDDKLVACGREAISSIAVDGASVVWTEPGKGVFRAAR